MGMASYNYISSQFQKFQIPVTCVWTWKTGKFFAAMRDNYAPTAFFFDFANLTILRICLLYLESKTALPLAK